MTLDDIQLKKILGSLQNTYGFSRITLKEQARLEALTQDCDICDLHFPVLFAWKTLHQNFYLEIEGVPCVLFVSMERQLVFYPLFCQPSQTPLFPQVIAHLRAICRDLGVLLRFEYIPHAHLPHYLALEGLVEQGYDVDFSDYVYQKQDFLDTTGAHNRDKRQHLKQLARRHKISYALLTTESKQHCLHILEHWCREKSCADCVFGCEAIAIRAALDQSEALGLVGSVLYLDAVPVSFLLAYFPRPDYVLYLFQKSSIRAKGLTEHLYLHFASQTPAEHRINFSEDMGLVGLRNYKQKFCDYTQVDKYFVTLTP